MLFLPKQNSDIPVSRDLKLLLIIGGLYALATFLSNTFVNIFLWKKSGEYLDIATYNLFIYLVQPIAFFVAGKCAKRVDRALILRIGVIVLSLFYILVLLSGDKATTYPYLLGSLLGMGYGFYWLSFNVLTFEITEPETRDFFNGLLGTFQSFGGMIGPLFAGYIISRMNNFTGYTVIFLLSFFLFGIAVVCSLYLQKRKATGKFMFRDVLAEKKRNKNWNSILLAHIAQGLREGLFIFIIAIWVYIETGSEFALGVYNLLFSFSSLICYILISRLTKSIHRKRMILAGGILLYVAVAVFVFQTNYIMLLTYGVIVGVSYPVFNVAFVSLTYDIIGKSYKARDLRIEYIIVREIYINIGRITAITIFILGVMTTAPSFIIPVLILSLGCGNLIAALIVRKTVN
ncbi:MFS transporter, YQGE family, putative transporter [Gracilibacillus ureilyticus]|uniref:MFS transporter, YQGE family, putative transporter n=1 Tax=Gracilibacillus ureilyticus TaxID=531814 RepID=A0A1H9M0H8_9BACI|nr:MFS transporter [Gracilibacillus ureilyticus]SER17141.1 MFS transporter, YQGE family, putative transporter [Gracilibacillus ureilyticus]